MVQAAGICCTADIGTSATCADTESELPPTRADTESVLDNDPDTEDDIAPTFKIWENMASENSAAVGAWEAED